jgi:hypothetical protein
MCRSTSVRTIPTLWDQYYGWAGSPIVRYPNGCEFGCAKRTSESWRTYRILVLIGRADCTSERGQARCEYRRCKHQKPHNNDWTNKKLFREYRERMWSLGMSAGRGGLRRESTPGERRENARGTDDRHGEIQR